MYFVNLQIVLWQFRNFSFEKKNVLNDSVRKKQVEREKKNPKSH